MEGERNLTEDSLSKFAVGLGLNQQETEFFRSLVYFNQAATHVERDRYYRQMLQSRKYNALKPIEKGQYEYYSGWHHPVVRELACSDNWDGTHAWLARRIQPRLTDDEIAKSLKLLESLGFLRKVGDRYVQSEALITTGAEAHSVGLHNYHQAMLDVAKELLPSVPSESRDVSALTLGVSTDKIPAIKKRIRAFRKDLLKLVADDQPEDVISVTIQMLPLTRP